MSRFGATQVSLRLFVCFAVLPACARPVADNASDLRAHMAPPSGYSISCDLSSCPSSVGLFIAPKDSATEPMHCTAVLLSETLAVTAGHCLGDSEKGCLGAWVGFAQETKTDLEWFKCAGVRHLQVPADPGVHTEPDYGVIALDRATTRPGMRLAVDVADKREVVTVIAVKVNEGFDKQHRVATRRCRIAGEPTAWRAMSAVQMLSECPIELGDSGAPVVDASGGLLGVVHAGTRPFFAVGAMTTLRRRAECPSTNPKKDYACAVSPSLF